MPLHDVQLWHGVECDVQRGGRATGADAHITLLAEEAILDHSHAPRPPVRRSTVNGVVPRPMPSTTTRAPLGSLVIVRAVEIATPVTGSGDVTGRITGISTIGWDDDGATSTGR